MARVAELLESWARARGEGPEDVARWTAAGNLHDALREENPERLKSRVEPRFLDLPGKALHGPGVAMRLQEEGVADEELLHAIAYHTMGSPGFGTLGLALYAADFLEPGRKLREKWRGNLRKRAPARAREGGEGDPGGPHRVSSEEGPTPSPRNGCVLEPPLGGPAMGQRVRVLIFLLVLSGIGIGLGSFLGTQTGDEPEIYPRTPAVPGVRGRVKVEVLNGSGVPGVAWDATRVLRGKGFDVVSFGNAGTYSPDSSVVKDRVGHAETANLVAEALGLTRVLSEPDSTLFVDVTVHLGPDWDGSELAPEPIGGEVHWWDLRRFLRRDH